MPDKQITPLEAYKQALLSLEQGKQDYIEATQEIESLKRKLKELENKQETLERNNNIALKTHTQLPQKMSIVREFYPLALATNQNFIEVSGSGWLKLTRLVTIPEYTTPLPNSERQYQLNIHQSNNGIKSQGHSRFRIYYEAVRNADNSEYSGYLGNSGLEEASTWEIITLKHLKNPYHRDKASCDSWLVEGCTSGCTKRIYSISLAVVDVLV